MYFIWLIFKGTSAMQVQVASGITTCQLKLYQAWDTAIIYLHLHNFDLSQYHLI